ncbi:MAG: hypothetical protein LPK27_12640, partial [Rhodococcus sp. (in: high G+C Gram-positive bacteria)]|nr:hypothetical protein [Rhodococcus sp. (in: high G+C Gram-positive bacteria)]
MALTARPPDQGRPTDTDDVQAERNTWHVQEPDTVVAALNSDRHSGLTAGEAGARRRRYGLNEIAS